ncbi:MAG: SNF2 helicase associated domain-containing protein, partial [Myxococcales bacterium]|nr:SNF2 helicase associated domain-containing protein [Myxococcales bacterium]
RSLIDSALKRVEGVEVELLRRPPSGKLSSSGLIRIRVNGVDYFGTPSGFDLLHLTKDPEAVVSGITSEGELTADRLAILLLTCSYSDPLVNVMERPVWRLVLDPLTPDPTDAEPKTHSGRVTYHITVQPESGGAVPIDALTVAWLKDRLTRELHRTNLSTGKELVPRVVGSLEDSWDSVTGISRVDYEIDDGLARLAALPESSQATPNRLDGYAADLLQRVCQTGRCFLGEHRVTWLNKTWSPHLVLFGRDGQLFLRWANPPILVLDHARYAMVIDAEYRLRHPETKLHRNLWALSGQGVALDPDDVAGLIVFASEIGMTVDFEPGTAGMEEADSVSHRLILVEDGAGLKVELEHIYHRNDIALVAREGSSAASAFAASGDTWSAVARDEDVEAIALDKFIDVAESAPPLVLNEEAVPEFLATQLPRLAQSFEVLGESALSRYRVKSSLEPSFHFASGVDWFNLDVTFSSEGEAVSTDAVLAAWQEGKRYVRLSSGAIAALPTEWLKRRAAALDELRRLQEAAEEGITPTIALPLVDR